MKHATRGDGFLTVCRAKFLLDNRGGPQNLLPVAPEFGAGNIQDLGLNFKEFEFLCTLIEEVNFRLYESLMSMGRPPFTIDLIGLLTLVSDYSDTINWHKMRLTQRGFETATGEISVSAIPNSVLVYASKFFLEF